MTVTVITDSEDSTESVDADAAIDAADNAEGSADVAEGAADDAEDSADDAEESADEAEQSASEAVGAATVAQDAADASVVILGEIKGELATLPEKIGAAVRAAIVGTHSGQTVEEVESTGGILEPVMVDDVEPDSTPGKAHPFFRKWGNN